MSDTKRSERAADWSAFCRQYGVRSSAEVKAERDGVSVESVRRREHALLSAACAENNRRVAAAKVRS